MIKDYGVSSIDMVYNGHKVSGTISPVWTLPNEAHLDGFILQMHEQVNRMGETLRQQIAAQANG